MENERFLRDPLALAVFVAAVAVFLLAVVAVLISADFRLWDLPELP